MAGVVEVGLTAAASDALDLLVGYQGRYSASHVENAFKARARFRFWARSP